MLTALRGLIDEVSALDAGLDALPHAHALDRVLSNLLHTIHHGALLDEAALLQLYRDAMQRIPAHRAACASRGRPSSRQVFTAALRLGVVRLRYAHRTRDAQGACDLSLIHI